MMSFNVFRIFRFKTWATILTALVLLATFSNCNTNSDQLVYETTPTYEFQADQLISSYLGSNEADIVNEVIQVEGIVNDINSLNNRYTIILKGEQHENRYIICDMQNNYEAQNPPLVGEPIIIKGILKGALNDIILFNCIILN